MDQLRNSAPVLDEQQIAAELDLSSLLTSLADEQLITSILTKIARRSVMANVNTNVVKSALSIDGTSYPYQYTLEFPSGSPLLLVEVVADILASGNTVVIELNGQPFAATTTNLCSRPYVWVPPSTQLDIFSTSAAVVAHATGLQLAL
jgi:hypothetical protein